MALPPVGWAPGCPYPWCPVAPAYACPSRPYSLCLSMEALPGDLHAFAARPLSRRLGFLVPAESDSASRSPTMPFSVHHPNPTIQRIAP